MINGSFPLDGVAGTNLSGFLARNICSHLFAPKFGFTGASVVVGLAHETNPPVGDVPGCFDSEWLRERLYGLWRLHSTHEQA